MLPWGGVLRDDPNDGYTYLCALNTRLFYELSYLNIACMDFLL